MSFQTKQPTAQLWTSERIFLLLGIHPKLVN